MVHLGDIRPMLLDERPIDHEAPGWLFENKYDGYRLLAEFGDGSCKLKTRHGANATKWFPELCDALSKVPAGPHIVDGEVCVLDSQGRSDFEKLRTRAKQRRWVQGSDTVTYCVFDLLVKHGESFMDQPLFSRKEALHELLTPAPHSVLVVTHLEGHGRQLLELAAETLQLEGIVAKKGTSTYEPGIRSPAWVKLKRNRSVPARRFPGR